MRSTLRFASRLVLSGVLCTTVALVPLSQAHAHYGNPAPSDASALSLLPVALSVAAPAMLLSAGAVFTVVAVDASARGTVLLLERASDGARSAIHFSGHLAVGVGAGIVATAVSAGWVLSAAGEALAFIPNELGAALLYNERISR